ncbi:MAG: hypothetical protein HC933_05135 [Pleurocapsa sp. SU_196_0]|nr:hypothetical protein [Pleurocapsa sp. SU_196_0]
MTIAEAQHDMRQAYFGGSPGVLASGLVWLASGVVALLVSPTSAVLTLFIGGMFIFPLSVLLCKAVGCSGKHSRKNPLGSLAVEGTFWMLLCFPVAFAAFLYEAAWFFPVMLLIIAGRYLTFQTLYGTRLYWLFGVVLGFSPVVLVALRAGPSAGAFLGGSIEVTFAAILFFMHRRTNAT